MSNCTKCKAELADDSKFCPSCGKSRPTRINKIGRAIWIVGGIVVGLGVLGAMMTPSPHGTGEAKVSVENAGPAAMAVTAKELAAAYEANEAAAQQKYGGHAIKVSGTIAAITLDFANDPVVNLEGKNEFTHVMLNLAADSKAKAAGLSKGQEITATCEDVSEVIGSPILKACVL